MRHGKSKHQLNRFTSWHKATLKSLAQSIVLQQSIKTTLERAKAVRPLVEQLISLAKKNDLAAKRKAFQLLGDHKLVHTLFAEIGPRFSNRAGGYTRIINIGQRRGDDASLVIFELTEIKKREIVKHKKEKTEKAPHEERAHEQVKEITPEQKQAEAKVTVKEKPPVTKKPSKKFLGGLRNIFKKERDSL